MANGILPNDVNDSEERDSILRRDRWIDPAYIKDFNHQTWEQDETRYIEEPWKHCKNPMTSYLSLRKADRVMFTQRSKDKLLAQRIQQLDGRVAIFRGYGNKTDLLKELEESRKDWQEFFLNESNLEQIKQDRAKEQKRLARLVRLGRRQEDKIPLDVWDEAHNAQLALHAQAQKAAKLHQRRAPDYTLQKRLRFWPKDSPEPAGNYHPNIPSIFEQPSLSTSHQSTQDAYYGFKMGVMHFKKDSDGTLKGFDPDDVEPRNSEGFPNRKIPMKLILQNEAGVNNPLLESCPKDVVRYFHFPSNNMEWLEKCMEQYYSVNNRKGSGDCERILAREHWSGLVHGSGRMNMDQKRARPVHSRHMRSKCLLIPRESQPSEKNIALFLPYLHWETSSRREQMVNVINEETAVPDSIPDRWNQASTAMQEKEKERAEARSEAKSKAKAKANFEGQSKQEANDKNPRSKRRRLLARYLLALARTAEELDYEADERLLRDKVKADPPLHIRRSLDQYYFMTLENTSERDKDQVIYRATKKSRLTTQVIMVDQLWLWILDDHTIITSFPRRWGRNKPDPSGVHKSLRERLTRKTEAITSIHHLAMIIIDQCSRVFFDRTTPLDQRPEVMDLFAAAIGSVTEKTRVGYDNFWRGITLDKPYQKPMTINPEGKLLKEAQDIAEELMIMKKVYGEQMTVVKDFRRHLLHLQNPPVTQPDAARSADKESVPEADELVELLHTRSAEIEDLESAAIRACKQASLEGLLSLKQQQASIVDARAALETANETFKQGRTIQAFTIVTIIFLPLGFIAAFFGMNNLEINNAPWMSLGEQTKWMFGGSAVVTFVSVTLAFGAIIPAFRAVRKWFGSVVRLAFEVTKASFFYGINLAPLKDWWKRCPLNSDNIDRKRRDMLKKIRNTREERKRQAEEEEMGPRRSDSSMIRRNTQQQGTV